MKLLFFQTDEEAKQARILAPGKPFQPDLIFVSKAGRVEHLSVAFHPLGQAPDLAHKC